MLSYNQIYNGRAGKDKLSTDREVLIVGGGVIGLSIARELHKRGIGGVTVLDAGSCGREASWAAAGMLGPQAEADGTGPFFDLCCASRDLYPQFVSELFDETGIDVELDTTGTLSLAFNEEDGNELLRRYAWQRDAGLAIESLSRDEVIRAEPYTSTAVTFGLFFPDDWQVENRKLVTALRQYAELNEIRLLENTTADQLIFENGQVTGVYTAAGELRADVTLLTAGAWSSQIKLGDGNMPIEVRPVRGQIITLTPPERSFRHVVYTHRGYIVPRIDGRLLVGSTTEHVGFSKDVTALAAAGLRSVACEISPSFSDLTVADHWSGLRPYSAGGMPVLGCIEDIKGLFLATGHYRNGILLAPITAKLMAGLVLGDAEARDAIRPFDADRVRLQSAVMA